MGGKAAEDSAMPNASPIPSYRTSRRWTKEEAVAALAALAASGPSMRAFASREGLDVQRLYLWRRKLEKKNKPARPPFVEVRASHSERVEVVLRSGRVLRCAEEISSSVLRRFIEALEEQEGC